MSLKVSICNMALREAGLPSITTISERSPQAESCAVFFDQSRDEVLRGHTWNFAQKSARLALLDKPDGYDFYTYVYKTPEDCITAVNVRSAGSQTMEKFEVRMHPSGDYTVVCSDAAFAVLDYTAQVANVELFDAQFIRALALCLGAKLAADVRKNYKVEQALMTKLENFLNRAKLADAQEGKPEIPKENPWIVARFGIDGVTVNDD